MAATAAARIEKALAMRLGIAARVTVLIARNWKTVTRLRELVTRRKP